MLSNGHGWQAIDPQGIVGEREYDTAAAMRNPYELPESDADLASLLRRRANQYATILDLDEERIMQWAFAQTVLSLCWQGSDGRRLTPSWVRLAAVLLQTN